MPDILELKLSPADQFFVSLVARSFTLDRSARIAYGIKGDDISKFTDVKMEQPDILAGIERARAELSEKGCVSRAEKRWKLSHFIRENPDPGIVLKAVALDNDMMGDVSEAKVVTQYVARAGDVLELDDDCV